MKILLYILSLVTTTIALSQNPLIMDQYTADPSARVFNGKVYVYPSHDIRIDTRRFANWFAMEDYHVFSSENLTDWTDHGVILNQNSVDWVDEKAYAMWAPDCIEKNGKYYFYYPAIPKDKSDGKERRIAVAVADSPSGPFLPESKPMENVFGIDPNPFIDKDGQAYLYWGGGETIYVAKLKGNMLELATEPQPVVNLPPKFKEGPYVFERNGYYYFTFPHVPETTERLVYAMGNNPMGPFEFKGAIMEESPTGCWTNHHSIIEFQNQWYLFYHHNDLSPAFDKNRSIKADSLFFNPDGTIQPVKPTLRGVGVTNAKTKIQLDRYTAVSTEGVTIDFVDSLNRFQGWKTILNQKNAWISYNQVEFSTGLKTLKTKLKGEGRFELRLNTIDGTVLAKLDIENLDNFAILKTNLLKNPIGVNNLILVSTGSKEFEIDWINFE